MDGVFNLINQFVAEFADDHFVVSFRFFANNTAWAGIKIENKQGTYRVTKLAGNWPSSLPPLGAELLSCDGRAVKDIMNMDILRYRFANYADNFPRVRFTEKLFIDDRIGHRNCANECTFRTVAGGDLKHSMTWQSASMPLGTEWDTDITPRRTFTMDAIGDSLLWVQVPTLMPGDAAQVEKTITSLAEIHPDHTKTIIFDVRGNRGGDSTYALKLLEAAIGKAALVTLLANDDTHSLSNLYRVSRDNLHYFKSRVAASQHNITETYLSELVAGMEKSINHKENFIKGPTPNLNYTMQDVQPLGEIAASLPRIVMLTDNFAPALA